MKEHEISAIQELILERIQRMASYYTLLFYTSAEEVLEQRGFRIMQRSSTLMGAVVAPFGERLFAPRLDEDQLDARTGRAVYRALNFVCWEAFVNEFLPQAFVEEVRKSTAAMIATFSPSNTEAYAFLQEQQPMHRHIVCDAVALHEADACFVHPEDPNEPYIATVQERRSVANEALLYTAHLADLLPLSKEGLHLELRIRLLAALSERFQDNAGKKETQAVRTALWVHGADQWVGAARALFGVAYQRFRPSLLLRAASVESRPRLSLVHSS